MELIADTTFLVGLWRRQSWAVNFATKNSQRSLGISWVVLGEFWHGAMAAGHDPERVEKFLEIGMPITDAGSIYKVYAKICSGFKDPKTYRQIGQNDLWIAAVALKAGLPLVTRNLRHFGEIDGLKLEVLE